MYRNTTVLFLGILQTFPGTKFWIRLGTKEKKRNKSHATILDKRERTTFCSGVIFTQWPHFTVFNENICNAKYVAKLQMLLNAN